MTTEDSLIQRLLGEAEEAVVRLDWTTVQARCNAVLALEPGHERATRLRAAAARALADADHGQPPSPSQSLPTVAEEPFTLVNSPVSQAPAESNVGGGSPDKRTGSQQSEFATEAWYQSTPAVIGAFLVAPPLGLYLMWDDLHGSAVVRWIVTAIGLLLLVAVLAPPTNIGYALYLIGATLVAALLTRRRGSRAERIETHRKVVEQRRLGLQQPTAAPRKRGAITRFLLSRERERQRTAARVQEEGRRHRAAMGTLVQEYATMADYQREAAVLHAEGWRVTSSISRQPRSGCLRIFTLGLWSLIFPPKPVFVVTYVLEGPTRR